VFITRYLEKQANLTGWLDGFGHYFIEGNIKVLKRKNKAEIVLRALLSGHPVKLNGTEYRMGEDYSLGVPIQGEDAILPVVWSLKNFIGVCQKIDDEHIMSLVSSMTLTEHKKV
jgi:hypothetical protein